MTGWAAKEGKIHLDIYFSIFHWCPTLLILFIAFAAAVVAFGTAALIRFAIFINLLIYRVQQPMHDLVVLKGFAVSPGLVVLSSQLLEFNAQLLRWLIEKSLGHLLGE